MTYGQNNIITAGDFNLFRNNTDAIFGVGSGDSGYGQVGTYPASVVSSSIMQHTEWGGIDAAVQAMTNHQGGSAAPPASDFLTNALVKAYPPNGFDMAASITAATTNRLTAAPAAVSVTTQITDTRSTSWTSQVLTEFTVTFGSEDLARFFFNSGGQVRMGSTRTGGTGSTDNTNWTTLLSTIGTVGLGARSSTISGAASSFSGGVGYYSLTGSYQAIVNQAGTGVYSSNTYTVQARTENVIGLRGANGTLVRCQVILTVTPPFHASHVADGTLTTTVSMQKATTFLTVASPAFSTVTSLIAGS